MPTATPDNVMSVLAALVRSAASMASGAPNSLSELLTSLGDQAGDDLQHAKQLPDDVVDDLRKKLDPPDWWSLLAFILIRLRDLDKTNLRVGAAHPPGWSRMLTLGYAPDDGDEALVVIGLGITDKTDRDGNAVKRGIMVRTNTNEPIAPTFPPNGQGTFTLVLTVPKDAHADWEWAFGSGAKAPDGVLGLKAEFTLTVPKLMPDKAVAGIDVGAVKLIAEFGSAAPNYKFSLSVAPARDMKKGIEAHLDPAALLGDVPILSIAGIHEGVSAQATLAQGSSPQFTFTQEHL
jgi:hypothetical protein